AGWTDALAKLTYCDRVMKEIVDKDPLQTDDELDEDVAEISYSLAQFYEELGEDEAGAQLPQGLDGALRAIFEDLSADGPADRRPASELIHRVERELTTNVFVWTGHFPERTRALVRHLADRADALELSYPESRDQAAVISLTTLVAALGMN